MKKHFILFAIILSIIILPTTAFAVPGNHVINGDFEEADYIKTDWDATILLPDEPESTVDFISEEGNTFAMLVSKEPNYINIMQSVFLQANTSFEIGARVKINDVGLDGEGAVLRLEQGQGESAQVKGTFEDWQEIKFYVTTSDADVYTSLEIALGDANSLNSGSVMVDDIYIVETDSIPVGANHTVIEDEQPDEIIQQPVGSTSTEKTPTQLFSQKKHLAIILLLFAMVVFMFLISWIGNQKKSKLEDRMFTGNGLKLTMVITFAFMVAFKYYVGSLGTDLGSDIGAYINWTESLATQGIRYFYSNTNCIYPCGYMYVLWAVGKLAVLFNVAFDSLAFNLMLKTPVIITEILTALLAYHIAKKRLGEKNAAIISFVMLMNPAVIINTSSWGQMDAVYMLAIVFALYLLEQKRSYWAAGVFTFSILIKTQAILFLPVFGAYYLQLFLRNKDIKANLKEFFISVGIALATYWLVSIPFMGDNGIFWQFTQVGSTANHFGYTSLNAFNLYTLFGGNYKVVTEKFFLFSYQTWGYIFIVLSSLISVFLVFYNRKKQMMFLIAAFMIGAVFTLGHGMHERYILPLPILIFFAYIYNKDSRLMNLGILYTVFALLSQMAVLFFFGASFYKAIVISLSLFSLALFGYLTYVCYLLLYKKGTTIKSVDAVRPDEVKRKTDHANAKLWAKIKRQPIKRLHTKNTITRINKHDRIIIIVMTLIYAVIAFINLGDFKIADSAWKPVVADETLVFELQEASDISAIKYYFGLGGCNIHVTASLDGENYYQVGGEADENGVLNIKFDLYKIYSWRFLTTNFNAKYIAMTFDSEDVDVREIGFVGTNGKVLPIKNVTSNLSSPNMLRAITDEQDMIPEMTSYMSNMYFDEIYHARTALEYIEHRNVYEITHPPLGKWFISLGIRLFGMTPFGWRFMGTLFGVLMIPIMYILSKRLLKRTLFATMATFLLMSDFMHFAQTRIATIDSYSVVFIMLMFLFMYDYTMMNINQDKLYKTFVPLGLAGLFFGFGAATKWLCLYAGAGLAVIFFYTLFLRYREYEAAKLKLADGTAGEHSRYYKSVVSTFYYKLFLTLLFCVIMFIIVPAVIYYLSYTPYMRIEKNPYGFRQILDNQSYMWNYHAHLKTDSPHPFASRWYTWMFDIRPVYFFQGRGYPNGVISSLSSFGNPIIWWTIVPSLIMFAVFKLSKYKLKSGLGYAMFAGLSNILPWIFISRETFIYHFFASVPFAIIIITFALKHFFENTKRGKYFVLAYLGAAFVCFILFYPFITGIPVSSTYANAMRWLGSWPFY